MHRKKKVVILYAKTLLNSWRAVKTLMESTQITTPSRSLNRRAFHKLLAVRGNEEGKINLLKNL